jgi:8-oxo-dGTP pyrophosphatase MutT (NUDIX family)
MSTRRCARVVVVDSRRRVLLLKYEDRTPVDPAKPDLLRYWVTPGGGVRNGETYEDAARRELWEETDIEVPAIGPWIWTRERRLFHHDQLVLHHERYFVARLVHDAQDLCNRTEEPIRAHAAIGGGLPSSRFSAAGRARRRR